MPHQRLVPVQLVSHVTAADIPTSQRATFAQRGCCLHDATVLRPILIQCACCLHDANGSRFDPHCVCSSGDSNNGLGTWYNNMQSTVRFQTWDDPISRPGCWACKRDEPRTIDASNHRAPDRANDYMLIQQRPLTTAVELKRLCLSINATNDPANCRESLA